jgi:hypothetical protein
MKNSFKLFGSILIAFWVIITGCLLIPNLATHNIILSYLYAITTLVFAVAIIYRGVEWLINDN